MTTREDYENENQTTLEDSREDNEVLHEDAASEGSRSELESSNSSDTSSSMNESQFDNVRTTSNHNLRNIPKRNYSRLHRGYIATVGGILHFEPNSYTEAMLTPVRRKWEESVDEEMKAHAIEKT